MVERFAYWTDDETCKVNVNTASEGIYWDSPYVDTTEDRSYAKFPPHRGECQRYPGHPAMTCLSSVLFPNEGRLDPRDPDQLLKLQTLWSITPGIGTGGSVGGTAAPPSEEIDRAVEIDPVKLHEKPSDLTLRGVSEAQLERAAFFLTSKSAAPEVDFTGSRPRISIWPIPEQSRLRSVYDERIAAAATLKHGFYGYTRNEDVSRHDEVYLSIGS